MSHSIQHVHFPELEGGAGLPPTPAAELERLTEALSGQLEVAPPDVIGVRWRDRPERYGAWLQSAIAAVTSAEPDVAGGWTTDFTSDPSITSPDGDRWLRINGASFALAHSEPTVTGETYLSIIDDAGLAAGPETVTVEVENGTSEPATGAVLVLQTRRARVDAVRPAESSAGQGGALQVEGRAAAAPAAWILVFETPLAPGGRAAVEVEFQGDLPYVANVLWVTPSGAEAIDPAAKYDGVPRAISPVALESLAALARTEADDLAYRGERIERESDGERRAFQRFFLALDRDSDPPGVEPRVLRQVVGYLGQRVLVRAEDAGFGEMPTFDRADLERWQPVFVATAARVEELLLEHFPELVDDDTTRVAVAFEQFATGALRVFDTHGAPNGVSYFSFCELAILMTDYGVRSEFWARLLPIFARTSELFANAYHRCSGPRTVADYGVAFNLVGARTQGPAELAANRAAWAEVSDPVYSFGRIVHAALQDELAPGTITPFALEDFGCGGSNAALAAQAAQAAPSPPDAAATDRNWRGPERGGPRA